MMYGYVRVSAKDQNEERQVAALVDYGTEKCNIIIDKHRTLNSTGAVAAMS